MAAGIISKPGSQYGPCCVKCRHTDCEANRKTAESICHICGTIIGYETRFYDTDEGYVHAFCEEERIEKERIERRDKFFAKF